MSAPQAIIVYRNPLEAAMWESLMNGGFVIVFAVIVAAAFAAGIVMLIEKGRWAMYRASNFKRTNTGLFKLVNKVADKAGWVWFILFLVTLYTMHWWSVYH